MFVFENVPGLLTANKGKYFMEMRDAFLSAGYEIEHHVLNSKDFGVLQNRLRVILIGWKKKSGKFYPQFTKQDTNYTVADILYDLPSLQPGEKCNNYKSKR